MKEVEVETCQSFQVQVKILENKEKLYIYPVKDVPSAEMIREKRYGLMKIF